MSDCAMLSKKNTTMYTYTTKHINKKNISLNHLFVKTVKFDMFILVACLDRHDRIDDSPADDDALFFLKRFMMREIL